MYRNTATRRAGMGVGGGALGAGLGVQGTRGEQGTRG